MIRAEAEYFFAALRFFTRLPVPAWVGHSAEQLDHAARYFPAVGLLVGVVGAAVSVAATWVLPLTLAVLAGMAATIWLTGAFHEDGFSDACDGFGGGWSKEQVLAIMKDSRIGNYGAIGIMLMLAAKFFALLEFDAAVLPLALIAGHAASRFLSTTLIYALDYVRDDASSKARPLARRMSAGELLVGGAFGLAPCLLLPRPEVLVGLALAGAATWLAARYFVRRIGGYTGDCLGATQQVAELAFYVGLLCE